MLFVSCQAIGLYVYMYIKEKNTAVNSAPFPSQPHPSTWTGNFSTYQTIWMLTGCRLDTGRPVYEVKQEKQQWKSHQENVVHF